MPLSPSTLARLETQLDSIPSLLAGAAADAIRRRPPSGKWSAHENLAHIARCNEFFLERLQRILGENAPKLRGYRAEDDPEWPSWAAMPTEEVLERMKNLRSEIVARVLRLTPAELVRTGVHSRYGEMTIPQWLEFLLIHEGHHLYVVLQRLHEAA